MSAPPIVSRRSFRVDGQVHRRQLLGLLGGQAHTCHVSDKRLDNRGDRGESEGQREAEPMSMIMTTASIPAAYTDAARNPVTM